MTGYKIPREKNSFGAKIVNGVCFFFVIAAFGMPKPLLAAEKTVTIPVPPAGDIRVMRIPFTVNGADAGIPYIKLAPKPKVFKRLTIITSVSQTEASAETQSYVALVTVVNKKICHTPSKFPFKPFASAVDYTRPRTVKLKIGSMRGRVNASRSIEDRDAAGFAPASGSACSREISNEESQTQNLAFGEVDILLADSSTPLKALAERAMLLPLSYLNTADREITSQQVSAQALFSNSINAARRACGLPSANGSDLTAFIKSFVDPLYLGRGCGAAVDLGNGLSRISCTFDVFQAPLPARCQGNGPNLCYPAGGEEHAAGVAVAVPANASVVSTVITDEATGSTPGTKPFPDQIWDPKRNIEGRSAGGDQNYYLLKIFIEDRHVKEDVKLSPLTWRYTVTYKNGGK